MITEAGDHRWFTEDGVKEDLERQPHLFFRLAENALMVADSLRDNYFKNTAGFVSDLRRAMARKDPIISTHDVADVSWSDVQTEVVTFIDGGIGQVQIASRVPLLLRVGSYCVKTGERRLAERERFGYYPIILGDLEGGSKDRKDFVDIVRITAELLGGLSALERTHELRVLMFHGPLVYLMGQYAGHTPFTEADIDIFLHQYAVDANYGRQLKQDFLGEARLDIYPTMAAELSDKWADERFFEPLAWIAFLYRRIIRVAGARSPVPIVAGVVERGELREFAERILLDRVFRNLRASGRPDYFKNRFGRQDLKSPAALLERLAYNDSLLLAMLLRPGQYSEPWEIRKYDGLREGRLSLPGEAAKSEVNWGGLAPPSRIGFPPVRGCYVRVSPKTEPIRVEVFSELGDDQIDEAARRTYLYARLLPGYGFPVGLSIVDQYAHVPAWLTDAYGKLIRYHLSASLQRGEIKDAEMRRLLVQAMYLTHRDWLLRPDA